MPIIVRRRHLALATFCYCASFFVVCLISQTLCGAYHSDRGQAGDEAAHFVTSLMIFDYITGHLGENPLVFAKDYYLHFPRIAIGHWPPMFEVTQALVFVFGRTSATALAFQAVIAGLFAGLPSVVVWQRNGILAGYLAGGIAFFSPIALFLTNTVMADSFLGMLVFATALAWERLYSRLTWPWSLAFAATAAAAILTKGSAFGLALLPIIYVCFRRDILVLLSTKIIVSGVIIALITIPWYAATYKYAADGFNYTWGWSFTRLAIPNYAKGLVGAVGLPILLGYCIVLFRTITGHRSWTDVHVATSLAMISFNCIAPADITNRYLIPAIPSIAVTAVAGLKLLLVYAFVGTSHKRIGRDLGLTACVVVSVGMVFVRPHVNSFGAMGVVDFIRSQDQPNTLVLVAGETNFEGAMIAAFDEQEPHPYHYVVRSTKVLASGNFMGTNYKARFVTVPDMREWFQQHQIGYIVLSDDARDASLSHNRMLMQLIEQDPTFARRVAAFGGSRGEIRVYALPSLDTKPTETDPIFSEIALDK